MNERKFSLWVVLIYIKYCSSSDEDIKGFKNCKVFSQGEKVPAFQDGNFYVYQFKGRLSTGIQAENFHQYTGLEMSGNLVVQNFKGNVYMKIANEKMKKFHHKFNHSFEDINLLFEGAEDKPDKILTNPFGVNFEEDVIESIQFFSDPNNPKTHLEQNVQRSIASAFQLHLHPERNNISQSYVRLEKGIGGECSALYKVSPVENDTERMIIHKTHLYDTCLRRAQLIFSSFDGHSCSNSNSSQNMLRRNAQANYIIKGTKDKYVIEDIDIQSEMIFTPPGQDGRIVKVLASQTYVLIRTDATKPTKMHSQDTLVKSPVYEFNLDKRNLNEIDLKEPHHFNRFYDLSNSITIHEAVNLLSNISINKENFKEQSNLALSFLKEFSRYSYEDFAKFFKLHVKYKFKPYEEKKALWMFLKELLSFVGTNPSIMYLKHLIEEDQTCSSDWITIFPNIPQYAKEPSKILIEEIWDLLTKVKQKCKPDVYEAAVLSFGFLLYKGCVPAPFNPRPHSSPTYVEETLCLHYLDKLIENADIHLGTIQLDSPYMAAIKNTHMEATFPFFAKIIASSPIPYSEEHRRFAIKAMLNFLPGKDLEIFSIVAPIFYNQRETYILRTAAFEVLLLSRPSEETVDTIVEMYKKEPYMKVRSYIYRSMAAFAKSKYPCYIHLSGLAEKFLKSVEEPKDDSFRHSFKMMFDFTDNDKSFGVLMELTSLGSNISMMPREICSRFSFYSSGYNFDLYKGTVFNAGSNIATSILQNQFLGFDATSGFNTFKLSSHRRKSLIDDWYKNPQYFDEIFNQHVSHSMMNSDDIKIVPNFITQTIDTQILKKKSLYYNMEYTIPTEIGWPVTFSFEYMTVSQNKFVVAKDLRNVTFPHANFEFFSGNAENFRLAVEINKDGIYNHGIRLTSEGFFQFPLSGEISTVPDRSHLTVTIPFPEERLTLFHSDTNIVTVGMGGDQLKVIRNEIPFEETQKYGHEFFGLGLTSHYIYDDDDEKLEINLDFSFLHDLFQGNKLNKKIRSILSFFPNLKISSFSLTLEPSKNFPSNVLRIILDLQNISSRIISDTYIWNMNQFDILLQSIGEFKRQWHFHLESNRSSPVTQIESNSFHFTRYPIPEIDNETFEICFHSNAKSSDYLKIFKDILGFHQPRVNNEMILQFGRECKAEDSAEIILKARGERSDEQNSLDRLSIPVYEECKECLLQKFPYHESCLQVIKDQGRLDKFTFDVLFNNMSAEFVTDTIIETKDFIRSMLDSVRIENNTESNMIENEIQILGNISYYYFLLDIGIISFEEKELYQNISLPSLLPPFQPYTIIENYGFQYIKKIFNYHEPTCVMSGNHIKTTDDFIYQIDPKSECFYALLGDCTNDAVTILVKQKKNGKVIIVVVDDRYLWMDFSEESLVSSIILDSPVHILENNTFMITKYGEGVLINIKPYRMTLFFDGQNIELKVPHSFRGKQCGLCGDFDGEKVNEFVTLNGTVTENLEEFYKSYEFCKICESTNKHQSFCSWFKKKSLLQINNSDADKSF